MVGEFFYNFPSKDWTRTYLHINWLSPATTTSNEQSSPPTFALIAKILASTDAKVTVGWETLDPYEGELYTSHAVLRFAVQAQRPISFQQDPVTLLLSAFERVHPFLDVLSNDI